ncbi:MAG: hypothetical protein KHZ72_01280 [Lachnospiraceae bacterium]|nr:hypothetical protein [Lachnospiraceae bacterium]
MGKKEHEKYMVEREYLSKISVEELLVRIVKSHLKKVVESGEDSCRQ